MSSELESLIAVGHDITAIKYYAMATCTILFYDYLLMLADEIKYIWSERKSWMFWVFITNRYFPMTCQVWLLAFSYTPPGSQGCGKSAFFFSFMMLVCSLLAQVVLTARIYAVTSKNTLITVGFAVIAALQLALGIWGTTLSAKGTAQSLPPIPLDAYRLCIVSRHRALEIAYTSTLLLYDLLAFSLITFLAAKSKVSNLRTPSILETIAEDATWYFLVIFSSHFVFEMTLTLGRETIQALPGFGHVVFLPVMISRLTISLRKTANTQRADWTTSGDPLPNSTGLQSTVIFHSQRDTNLRGDDILLNTIHRL